MSQDERSFLTDRVFPSSTRRCYGTTTHSQQSNHSSPCPRSFISHKLDKSDSLQSLSVKYDVSLADIKRFNKLWNSESLSYRDTISIPLYDENSASTSKDLHEERSGENSAPTTTTLHINGHSSEVTTNDFFAKFDSSLSVLKKKVQAQVDQASGYLSDEDDVLFFSNASSKGKAPMGANWKGKGSLNSIKTSSSDDVQTTPEPVVRSKVKKKLRQHEEAQDEMFQL